MNIQIRFHENVISHLSSYTAKKMNYKIYIVQKNSKNYMQKKFYRLYAMRNEAFSTNRNFLSKSLKK